ncbi:Rid family hydrolase, partial [Klebsiella pneumoniae]|uniref:Rid family hydrolase n=1 Tax=Klebsiella pneumoniae TaxID=573 RepID=UPI003B841D3C
MTIIRNNPQLRLAASVAYGDLLFLSGQTPKSNEDDIVLQTREVLEKIDALLAAAGSDKQHILSAQIWLKPRFYVSTSKSIIKALINMHSFEIQL